MKWQVIDTKHNVADNASSKYTIDIEANKEGNILNVTVTVPKKQSKVKPVSWTNQEIKNWVKEKGFNTLTNETENSKIYTYELAPATPKQTKTRKKASSTAGNTTRTTKTTRRTSKTNNLT
jgi:hypothetical protein